jgi:dihydrofolate reductase
MATVISNLTMSLDGFIADHDDKVGPLFDWMGNGDVEIAAFGGHVSHVSAASAALVREAFDSVGAFVVGRRLYDHTKGWNGRPPADAPMVVVTHHPPDDWPRDGVDITFATDITTAIERAKRLAGDRVVSVAGGTVAREALYAGLMDELWVNLVPVIFGSGIPFLSGGEHPPILLEDPEVVQGDRVTHMRFRVNGR